MRVLLADDESMVRSALRLLIEQNTRFNVVGDVTRIDDLKEMISKSHPNLLLIDGELPGAQLDALLPEIRDRWSNLKVIVLSGRIESKWAAIQAGADAFISKGEPPDFLIETLQNLFCVCYV